jgi:tetratricopeptide (TPR) repeat protein
MDADTYPRQDVQEALAAFVCVHINAEEAGEPSQVAQRYGVDSFPRLMVLDPMGNKLAEIKGKPNPEGFGERLPYDLHSAMAVAAKAGDHKVAAEKMVILRRWFEGTKARKAADEWYAQLESNADFKAAYDQAWKYLEDDLAKAREEAIRAKEAAEKARIAAEEKERKDLMAQASEHSKKNRRDEAIECWKKVVEKWPESEEAKTAYGKLKFFGVKLEEPKK